MGTRIMNLVANKDRGRTFKRLKFEVAVFHTLDEDEKPEVIAKFKSYGDASVFAHHVAAGNVWYQSVVIR